MDKKSGGLLMSVEDQGVGISEDKIHKALEPFGQVDDNSDMRDLHRQGTGLGLPLAKAMVEMHGGSLEIQSESGKGTCVQIMMPEKRIKRGIRAVQDQL